MGQRWSARSALAMVVASVLVATAAGTAWATPPEPPPEQDVGQFCANVPAAFDPFSDDNGRPSERTIECLSATGITQGTRPGIYEPSGTVNRDQMASFIARLIDRANALETGAGLRDLPPFDNTNRFTDVRSDSVHLASINRLAAAGIVQGGPGGRPANQYGPGLGVQRDQMASFINRSVQFLRGSGFSSTSDYFTDDEFTVHEANINGIASEGIAIGDGLDSYRPQPTVTREQMAAFLIRTLAVLNEAGLIRPNPAPITVTLGSSTVAAGATVSGTITGEAASATVSGCGLMNEPTQDRDTATAGIQFTEEISNGQPAGGCTLTFTVTRTAGGTETVTANLTVTRAGTSTNTDLPELMAAIVVGTVPTESNTPTTPAGTTVRYTFDEPIDGFPPVRERFAVYGADSSRVADASTANAESGSPTAVLVLFPSIVDKAAADRLRVATVDDTAVTDSSGKTNPEGDAALGIDTSTTLGAAGVTDAPDVTAIGPMVGTMVQFRTGPTADQVSVDFTFDEAAFVTGVPSSASSGFSLVLVDGSTSTCTAPSATDTTQSGLPAPGGNGTKTITVNCGPAGTTVAVPGGMASSTTRPTAGNVARGVVGSGTVGDSASAMTRSVNPLQIIELANTGRTNRPDLESVDRLMQGTGTAADTAVFVFDVPIVTVGPPASFRLYTLTGREIPATAVSQSDINPANRQEVLVTFDATAADDAVGGIVLDGAVVTTPPDPMNNGQNVRDEVGIANVRTITTTAGRTSAPDLTAVVIGRGPNTSFGTPGPSQATFTFDADVDVVVASSPTFHLHLADGTRLDCTPGADANPTAEGSDDTVVCSTFAGPGGAAPTQNQIQSAVLGTVERGAVRREGASPPATGADLSLNPEGAAAATGGAPTSTTT